MQRLCRITVPGLGKSDFTAARERLLTDFPNVAEVVATMTPETLLVVYSGRDESGAWYSTLLDSIATRQGITRRLPRWRDGRLGGGDPAA
jgi:hypothetical protein